MLGASCLMRFVHPTLTPFSTYRHSVFLRYLYCETPWYSLWPAKPRLSEPPFQAGGSGSNLWPLPSRTTRSVTNRSRFQETPVPRSSANTHSYTSFHPPARSPLTSAACSIGHCVYTSPGSVTAAAAVFEATRPMVRGPSGAARVGSSLEYEAA